VSTAIDPRTVRPAIAAGVADEALEEINRLWTIVRAFSNAAHDVNNDLQVISGNAELLAGRELDPTVRKRVQAIREQAMGAATTINRLLSYSRSDPAAPVAVDACRILAEAVAMRRASLHRARIAVTSEPGPESCWAVADGGRTLQALINILLAAEEVAKRGREGRISTVIQRTPGEIAVCVTAVAGASAASPQDQPAARSRATAVTTEACLWAAAHLAMAQDGHLGLAEVEQGQMWTLRLRAVEPIA
jgi:signal transduction histidine kinase